MALNNILYAQTWNEVSREQLTEDELKSVVEIEVVAGEYGKSAKITRDNGVQYYPIHRDSNELQVGAKLDPKLCWIIHLKRGVMQTTDKLLYQGEPIEPVVAVE